MQSEKEKQKHQPITVEAADMLAAMSKKSGIGKARLASDAIITVCRLMGDEDLQKWIMRRAKVDA
jgi:hypothetical protein